MLRPRVMPCLLLKNKGLVKTIQFKNPRYIGDPINAVWIFNKKETDELIFLDIMASREGSSPDLDLISKISRESFMPLTVGGGIRTIQDVKSVFNAGAEKVAINSQAMDTPVFITEAANIFGNQSIVVSIDAKKNKRGEYEVYVLSGTKATGLDPSDYARKMESLGAGEILINSIDRDGTGQGYDIDLIKMVTDAVNIPVIACGGAGSLSDLAAAVRESNASAVAAGSLFVFHGKRKAVLINYPGKGELKQLFINTADNDK